MEPSATASRTDGWLASGREKPILRRRRRPPQPCPRPQGSPPASCAAMWWHTPPPAPLELRPHSVHNGLWITAKRMRPAAGRYRSRAGHRWAAPAAQAPVSTVTTGSGSTWTRTAPQCRRQQHDQSLLPLSLRCCFCQSRPSADDNGVCAVRMQREVVAQHGKRSSGQQTHGQGGR